MRNLLFGILILGSLSTYASNIEVIKYPYSYRIYQGIEIPTNPAKYDGCSLHIVANFADGKKKFNNGIFTKELWQLNVANSKDQCLYTSPKVENGMADSVLLPKL